MGRVGMAGLRGRPQARVDETYRPAEDGAGSFARLAPPKGLREQPLRARIAKRSEFERYHTVPDRFTRRLKKRRGLVAAATHRDESNEVECGCRGRDHQYPGRPSPEGVILAPSPKRSSETAARFTEEERAAMKERVNEMKSNSRAGKDDGERDVLAKIATMPKVDRVLAERLHAIIKATAPGLAPRTWYGMPAYSKDGQILCFFQAAAKFKTRYATLGFSDEAKLDEGHMWPTAFALTELTAAEEARIAALLKRALS